MKTRSEWAQMLSFAGKVFKVAIIYMFKELKKKFFFKEKKKGQRLNKQKLYLKSPEVIIKITEKFTRWSQ